jgi:hypothetical protein
MGTRLGKCQMLSLPEGIFCAVLDNLEGVSIVRERFEEEKKHAKRPG